jgi:hypothetical protein
MALGRYVGVNMLIPFAGAAVLWWLLNRKITGPAKAFVPACAVQGGHAMWMLVGIVAAGGANYGILDICLVAGGLLWLMAAPSLA